MTTTTENSTATAAETTEAVVYGPFDLIDVSGARNRVYLIPAAESDSGKPEVFVWGGVGAGEPERAWHHRWLCLGGVSQKAVPASVEAALREHEESIVEISGAYRGHEWDGSNHVGTWAEDFDSDVATQEIEESLGRVETYCAASDYYAPVTLHEVVDCDLSLEELVAREVEQAAGEYVLESSDVCEWIEAAAKDWLESNSDPSKDDDRDSVMRRRLLVLLGRDVDAVAAKLGVDPDTECTPDGIDWGCTHGPAEGAPVFLLPGYRADDGNAAVDYPDAETGRAAAEEYVADGDWGDPSSETTWIRVSAWQVCVSVDADGQRIEGSYGDQSHTIAVEPEEPECAAGHEHEWTSPHEIVGGIEENPGVQGHGGGVICEEVCLHCGCTRITDTWAQCPETGEQGLTSVKYDREMYAEEIAEYLRNQVIDALADIADAHAKGDSVRISGYAPDYSAEEYGGNTEPGSAWDDECDRLLSEVRDALPAGWSAEWSDDDVVITRSE